MLWKYLMKAAIACFLATAFVTFSTFFLMMGEIIEFGPPPHWLAYGFLATLFFAGLAALSFVATRISGSNRA